MKWSIPAPIWNDALPVPKRLHICREGVFDAESDVAISAQNPSRTSSGGYWERGEQDGTFRVIILLEGWEHLSNRVFLQWVRCDGDNQSLIVEKTVPIKEINDAGNWRITVPRFVKTQIILPAESQEHGKTSFSIMATPDHGHKIYRGVK